MMMDEKVSTALRETFGYVPDERPGEKWVVYRDNILIVTHPPDKPRLYERGCRGSYFELDPDLMGLSYSSGSASLHAPTPATLLPHSQSPAPLATPHPTSTL